MNRWSPIGIKNMKKNHALLAVFAALVFGLATGFSATKFQQKQFAEGDANGDKSLTQKEYVAVKLASAKKSAQKNNREFNEKKVAARQAKAFARHDTDGNGKLSIEEFYASFPAKKK